MNDKNELEEKKLRAIELLASGENISNTAKLVGVNRKTVSAWMKKEGFKAEVDSKRRELKSNIESKLLLNIDPIINRVLDIATHSKSDKTALDACTYLINRVYGTPTNKNLNVNEEVPKDKADINWDELEQMMDDNEDNVIELKNVK